MDLGWTIYLIELADKVIIAAAIIGAFLFCVGILTLAEAVKLYKIAAGESNMSEEGRRYITKEVKIGITALVIAIICGIIIVFVPRTQTLYNMLGVHNAEELYKKYKDDENLNKLDEILRNNNKSKNTQ